MVRTAFVATYAPRRCGIATFTSDLARAVGSRDIAVLHPSGDAMAYPDEVRHVIRKDHHDDYLDTARALNRSVDLVSVQHEYGIWGGADGERVLDFIRALRVPAVVTMHTVLRAPTPHQRAVLSDLGRIAEASVVMSRSAADLLIGTYGADPDRVVVIPHGVPDVPLVDSNAVKPSLGVAGRDVILSFGLLGPGKGYELAIEAMPEVVAAHANALYVILGATHPELIRREGEAYRESLTGAVERLGMTDHVRFVDKFVSLSELMRWLEAADVFVTPYPNLSQIVSGTLSYAMGAGRAIVSTPYTYAEELLADGRGVLVAPGSPSDLAAALGSLIGDPTLRARIGSRAFAFSRRMVWSAVGAEYQRLFSRLIREVASVRTPAPQIAVPA
jgi:glycosyltransferase involved in cell wall biosynthesis